jgi:hypothetical protein
MTDKGEGPELITNEDAKPQKGDADKNEKSNTKIVLTTLGGGSALAGICGYIARIVDPPWSICANGAAILCLILTMGAAVYELYPQTKGYILGGGMVLAFASMLLVGHKIENAQPRAKESSPPVPASMLSIALEQPAFHEKIGQLSVVLGSISFLGDSFPMSVSGMIPPHFYVENGTLYLDVVLFGDNPHSFAVVVEGNEFTVNRLGWDRNSSANALEVVNDKLVPVLQLIRLTPSSFRLTGMFPVFDGWPKGSIWVVDDNEFGLWTPDHPFPPYDVTRIFKYPSWKFPGKYADGSN